MAKLNPMLAGHLHQEKGVMLDKRKNIIFKGKLFYLDLSRNKQTQLLAKAICKMGGVIEGFLSKDVNYVVTGSRETPGIVKRCSGDKREVSLQRKAAEKMETTPCSRGKQLLRKVIQNQECSSVLTSARSWGVRILHVDEVLDYFELPKHRNNITEEMGSGCIRQTLKVVKLKSPFLKIEDHSRKFRPLQCSFTSFPELSFISSDKSPFETACTNNNTPKDQDLGRTCSSGNIQREEDEVEKSMIPQAWEKSGYCECCQVEYTKLSEHLINEQHCCFALDASKYKVIDDLTAHITCDLMEMPYESKPAEQHIEYVPCTIKEPPLSDAEVQEMTFPKILYMENTVEENEGWLTELLSLENPAANPADEHKSSCLLEKLPVENRVESLCVENIANARVSCKVPLLLRCETGGGSHFGHVAEGTWCTKATVLTSVYTVQSVFISPAHVTDEPTELDTPRHLYPQILLSTLEDPLHALVTDDFDSCNEPIQVESLSVVNTEPQMITSAARHCTKLIVDEPFVAVGELCKGLSAGSLSGKECSLHPLDTSAQLPVEIPVDSGMSVISITDSAVEVHEKLLFTGVQNESFLNASCGLHAKLSTSLSLDQLTLVPVHPSPTNNDMVTPSSAFVCNLTGSQDQDQQSDTDWFRGKRKHCLSPSLPPAKRQSYQWQPAPVWGFNQFPDTGQWPQVPVFTDFIGKDSTDITGDADTFYTSCFNPKLVQYNASSDSDWDSQIPSQQYNVPQQSAHYGDLRTAQINLSKSRYAKQLCSVLAHDQTQHYTGSDAVTHLL